MPCVDHDDHTQPVGNERQGGRQYEVDDCSTARHRGHSGNQSCGGERHDQEFLTAAAFLNDEAALRDRDENTLDPRGYPHEPQCGVRGDNRHPLQRGH